MVKKVTFVGFRGAVAPISPIAPLEPPLRLHSYLLIRLWLVSDKHHISSH